MLVLLSNKKYTSKLALLMVKLTEEASCNNHDEIPHSKATYFCSLIDMGLSDGYL